MTLSVQFIDRGVILLSASHYMPGFFVNLIEALRKTGEY